MVVPSPSRSVDGLVDVDCLTPPTQNRVFNSLVGWTTAIGTPRSVLVLILILASTLL